MVDYESGDSDSSDHEPVVRRPLLGRERGAPVVQSRPLVQVSGAPPVASAVSSHGSQRRPLLQESAAAVSSGGSECRPVLQESAAAVSSGGSERRPVLQESAAAAAPVHRVRRSLVEELGAPVPAPVDRVRRPVLQDLAPAVNLVEDLGAAVPAAAAAASPRPTTDVCSEIPRPERAASQGEQSPHLIAGGGDSPNEDDPSEGEEEEWTFDSLFNSFSKQWLQTQLTHHVSLAASNDFWKLAFSYVSQIHELKQQENSTSKIPQFLQIRKNMYNMNCPKVTMNFAFLNKIDQSIIHINVEQTPVKDYERNPHYQKLYEEAHIEVN